MRLEDYLVEKQFSDNLQKTVLNKIDVDPESILEIPDYLINDPEIVGYPDEYFQNDIYQWAMGVSYSQKVADIGCGRGDFWKKLDDFADPNYTGFETNPLMVKVGRQKYPEINIQEMNWMDYDGEMFDYIFFIGTLNQDYGYFDNTSFYGKYDYFKKILNHSLKFCNKSLIFILLQNAEEGFIEHKMEVIIDILCKENIPFQIDYSKYIDIYKLTIFKNND